ncbi:D-alanyl-D-alanine carboxypeptidase [Thermoclostridium stercorarium subsp. thermolacticum DSM 2910]|jgi:D-alanyl-D-alanine carboxypeptidase (penicillin-binding protein 5/6)|uniref:serine-type D-Ala-D-Ala carboxypeptidase n=1 Tax=Thermoclostridium stercorarium subsp. thermolacticum DSM 2910 TaxID=1121336 RepID=A0A1B1YDU2_THEST|nr:D-alanyl-D-alanine carboxypeptidase family protein [Thermoclostridium stercorarium]AGI39601.1 D-alanyl-D-alanine carboxypeptidase [Thermoclostridium stercorarium subsp. stercorarium DSM 8532]ANW98934.1 D-alanyl-D-alanine carboxypeptidase [Thermoclostridium stercorarium subsp. thermolacticum DSM 2910]UZQ84571.1 D-alanyl-D-alanine carboxypeptidase [Thermoclostridium stercorarium]
MYRYKRITSLIVAVVTVFLLSVPGTVTVSYAEDDIELTAKAAILVEMETGQVLYEKNADMRWSPASTTKIMTALVALENADINTKMKASATAINSIPLDYGIAGIKVGEELTLNDLLNFVLIISANEAANVIAENISPTGRIEDFVDMMNREAERLGLKNTHFTNSYGLDEDNHYSSARDLSIMAREAMKYPAFREIVAKKVVPLPDTNLRKSSEWENWHIESTNKLLNSTSQYYDRVTGIKTGYTDKAGRCLVFSAINSEGLELVGVILGTDSYDTLFKESQALLEYGYKNYKFQTLASDGEYYGRYEVADAVDNTPVDIQIQGEVTHLLPVSSEKLQASITVNETLNTPFSAPIEKGQVLGTKTWYYNGEEIGTVQLIAMNDVEKTMSAKIRDKIIEIVNNKKLRIITIILLVIIIVFIILRVILRGISRRRKYRSRYYRY